MLRTLLRLPIARRRLTTVAAAEAEFDRRAENTLFNLTDFFDALPDRVKTHEDYDVAYSMGVLTLSIGDPIGTYVINKQTPNRQLWLSSPLSGPKRCVVLSFDMRPCVCSYDWLDDKWIYRHDDVSMHALLEKELSSIYDVKSIGIISLEKQ